jgi:hypothetical protein
VDDARVEDLLCLLGKEITQVVHIVQLLVVVSVFLAEMWQQLLKKQVNAATDLLR